jgi:hypothetical protein
MIFILENKVVTGILVLYLMMAMHQKKIIFNLAA